MVSVVWVCGVSRCGCGCGRGRGVCVCAVWCGTLKTPVSPLQTPPCEHSKHLRVCWHHANMFQHVGVVMGTHGDVLNVHTEASWMDTRRRGVGVSSSVLLTKIFPRRVITCFRGSPKKPLDLTHFLSLRTGREQHVPDSSDHSLYLIKLLSSSSPEGNVGGNQL